LRHKLPAIFFTLLMLFLIAAIPTDLDRQKLTVIPIGTGILAVLCGILVFVAHFDKSYIMPRGRIKDLFVYIGSRSYSIYLAHPIAYVLTRETGWRIHPPAPVPNNLYSFLSVTAGLLLTIILAEASFRWIEAPFRAKGRAIAERLEMRAAPPPV
jgi:peptidoglycan/LPS O-acetylase OafA/YrhL